MARSEQQLKIVMFPWFSFGHFIPFLHLANKLAHEGHTITLLLPPKAKAQLDKLNLHPSLITLHPITIPHVDNLPPGSETTSDLPFHLQTHLATALDRCRPQVESIFKTQQPNLVFYDLAHWVPGIASRFGIKSVTYSIVCAAIRAYCGVWGKLLANKRPITVEDVTGPPPGYPSTAVVVEASKVAQMWFPFGEGGIDFYDRVLASVEFCDAIAYRSCREFEGKYCDYLSKKFNKPVFLSGPTLPEPEEGDDKLEGRWAEWLGRFEPGSVVFCTFGSQAVLDKAQFEELVIGFEMTKLPFLLALKPPTGCATVKEALPEGFEERVQGRGLIYGGWVPQAQILAHKSVGCFVSHCGPGTLWEALLCDSQMVFIPQLLDQEFNAKIMANEVKVGVEAERGENGWVSKESLCKAINSVMDEGSEIGGLVKKNHTFWRERLLSPGFMSDYIDKFIGDLQNLID